MADRSSLDAGRLAALVVAVAAAGIALVVSAELFPYRSLNHDEGVYLQQAAMLLDGRLFLRPPVEDAFRPWFFVESSRGLYSKYQPVPAAVFALGRLLGGYPLALAGVAAGLAAGTVALGRELFDARVGALAGVLLLATPLFVVHSGVYLPYALTTAFDVAFAVAYLRAERRGSVREAALAGVAVALAFLARPYTAVLFALPFVAHAGWTIVRSRGWSVLTAGGSVDDRTRGLVARRLVTASLGTAGVFAALAYNTVVTGDPFVFPYLAFAPEDGVGFGRRAILGHEVLYTPALGLRANALVLADLLTEWVVAGALGAAAAAVGVGLSLAMPGRVAGDTSGTAVVADGDGRTGRTPGDRVRPGLLAATYLTVAAGNVAFWGNYNVLGGLTTPDDGLIHYLGPYYHYDLVVPTAVFAAVACVFAVDRLPSVARRVAADRERVGRREGRAAAVVVILVAGAVAAGVAGAAVAETADRNAAVTAELAAGYGPLGDGGGPDGSVVFLPTPYGPWLNHPFQTLRNDPAFDGATVYALDDTRELAVADAYPERDLYRYVVAGSWVPTDDSTVRGALKRVDRVSGERVVLDATLGRPAEVASTTVRVTTDRGSAYLVADGDNGPLALRIVVEDGRVAVSGDGLESSGGNGTVALAPRDEVTVEVFVSTGPASGYSYRVVFPVESDGGTVRALSPTVERCQVPTRCVPQGVGDTPLDREVSVTLSNATD